MSIIYQRLNSIRANSNGNVNKISSKINQSRLLFSWCQQPLPMEWLLSIAFANKFYSIGSLLNLAFFFLIAFAFKHSTSVCLTRNTALLLSLSSVRNEYADTLKIKWRKNKNRNNAKQWHTAHTEYSNSVMNFVHVLTLQLYIFFDNFPICIYYQLTVQYFKINAIIHDEKFIDIHVRKKEHRMGHANRSLCYMLWISRIICALIGSLHL